MTICARVAATAVAVAAILNLSGSVLAQRAPAPQAMGAPAGPVVAGGPHGQFVDAYGNAAVVPASYCAPGYGAPGGYHGGYGYDEMADVFGGAGFVTEQCGPYFFDISGELIYWKRDTLGSRVVPFTSNNVRPGGSIVQSTDSVNPDFEPGFRVFGRFDIGALSVLEVGYTGLLNQNQTSSFVDATPDGFLGDLFSPFTSFGRTPPGGFDPDDLNDYEETDRATSHSLSFESDLQTAELNYRRYWVGFSPRVSGTLMAGFRYTRLDEDLAFTSIGSQFPPGASAPPDDPNNPIGSSMGQLRVVADNDLAGFQIGGDAAVALIQGVRLTSEGKVGIFNNRLDVATTFMTSDGDPDFSESFSNNQVAFIAEGRVSLVVDVLPSLSIKGGYEVLFLNSIATSVDNLNFDGIYDNPGVPPRVPALCSQGNAVFHGLHAGIEYIW